MALIKCSGCGAEISDKAVCCPKCGTPVAEKSNAEANPDFSATTSASQIQQDQEPDFVKKQKKNNKLLVTVLSVLAGILALVAIMDSMPKYYIAQLSVPKEEAYLGVAVVDGCMHKDKNCCQKVADAAESLGYTVRVVRIDPDSTAYKNSIGQAVSYDSALSLCRLCGY